MYFFLDIPWWFASVLRIIILLKGLLEGQLQVQTDASRCPQALFRCNLEFIIESVNYQQTNQFLIHQSYLKS